MKAIVRSAVGLVLVLGWWTFTGNFVSDEPALDRIPESVWGGGGGTLEIEATATTPARLHLSFGRDAGDEHLEMGEVMASGTHRWRIDVPRDAGGYVDFGAEDPKPGDRLAIRIHANGALVFEDESELEKPLEPGWAFGLQAYFDDYATGALGED